MLAYTYAQLHYNAQRGLINDLNDDENSDIKIALLEDTYTPGQNRHDCWSAPAWTASTAYSVGDKVIPTTASGNIYECVTAGTTSSGEPVWPTTDGEQVSDSGVVWECIANGDIDYFEASGTGYTAGGAAFTTFSLAQSSGDTVFTANDITWSGSNITARYAVLYDNTPAADKDKKLLCYLDFEANKSSADADFQIVWDTSGVFKTTSTQPA